MENKLLNRAGKVYFIAVAVLMYYFLNEEINLGVFVSYRHAFALVLAASTFLVFLFKPNIARGAAALKPALVYCTPLFVTSLVSLFIWFECRVDTDVITRGLSAMYIYCNMLSSALAAVAFLYIFGEKGIWYNLIAILLSNILSLGIIVAENGIGPFVSELITLIVTFAAETGDIIVQAEIHELAFCLGAYLIYMLLKPKKNVIFFLLLGLSAFCFLTSFKRIGIIAIAVALVFGWLLMFVAKFKSNVARNWTIALSAVLAFLMIGYVAIIKMDVFSMLEQAGIDTSGRVDIYHAVDKYYEFSPDYLGNGIGFLTYQLNNDPTVGVAAVHNDFLQYYIDLGFWGYILWLSAMTLVRVCYFGAKGKTDNAIITFALCVYLFVVSATDNTANYPLVATVLAIIMVGHGFDERVRVKEQKLFGYISKANRETKDGSML